MLKRVYPHQTPTAAAKLILMQVANNTDLEALVLSDAYSGLVTLSQTKIPSPSPARAPASDPISRELDLKSSDEECQERQIAELLRTLHWYGAKLAKDTGPDEFAARLVGAFPGKDLPPELHKASAWLGEKPGNRKKQLGAFLLGWMSRMGKGPAYTPRQTTVEKQAQQQNFEPPEGWI